MLSAMQVKSTATIEGNRFITFELKSSYDKSGYVQTSDFVVMVSPPNASLDADVERARRMLAQTAKRLLEACGG